MAFMAALESDLRALSAEARRRHPALKDAAERAILKLRSLSSPSDIAPNEDIVRIFLMACDLKMAKLSVIGLSCLQKLISHNAVTLFALKEILSTLKNHAVMPDENIQLKTLQTILVIFQSRVYLQDEENVIQAFGICLNLLESNRSSDNVRNTAAATFRQAVALIFDNVIDSESLYSESAGSSSLCAQNNSISDLSKDSSSQQTSPFNVPKEQDSRANLSMAGKLGLCLLEDLAALAAGGSTNWLPVQSLQKSSALDILEFVVSTYVVAFQSLIPYQQVLRDQVCSLLMTSLRTNTELVGEAGEPTFRRLVLRIVAHVVRLYNTSLVTESEVFLSMLVKVTCFDLPLWHRILVLEILRGFCVDSRTMRQLYQTFDMNSANTNVVENIVRALANVISSLQMNSESTEDSLAAIAGMFGSKAKGIEWSMDNDAPSSAVLVASEAHAICLAIEGLLGVVSTVATLTDEAVDSGELESPLSRANSVECNGKLASLCSAMVNSTWLTILDCLSLILMRSQGEAIILEILKGYQAFTQACGVLNAAVPLNSFLSSLCKFTINLPNEGDKKSSSASSVAPKKHETSQEQRDFAVLTPKNVQALRTLFNVAHRLHNVLGPSWVLVLDTLAALDRAIHSPHASTQEVSSISRLTRDTSSQFSDFHILSSLNSQLFESSALMNISAVRALLSSLHQLSSQHITGNSPPSSQQFGSISFSLERMMSILVNNLHRVEEIWDLVTSHLLELMECAGSQLRIMSLDALDHSICAVIGSQCFLDIRSMVYEPPNLIGTRESQVDTFESAILSPLSILYYSNKKVDIRLGSLKILLHVLERYGEKLNYGWKNVLQLLSAVSDAPEKDVISLGFQSVRVIMNEGLSTIPLGCLDECINITGAYAFQKTDINISLTAIGLLWTTTDFIVKGFGDKHFCESSTVNDNGTDELNSRPISGISFENLLFSVFSVLQKLGADDRPEVRNSAIRTLFQTLSYHGHKLSQSLWEDCMRKYVFPILDSVSQLAAESSKDEWQGKELGLQGGKAVHMLIHHSRNTAQKQWDETIVLVLGGIARLLRSFFPLLRELNNFSAGWELLLNFLKNSILNGSKEVALAAIACLQTVISSNCPKGNIDSSYIQSMLEVYELVLRTSANYKNDSADKVKQEVLHGLGELYLQAQAMFDNDMYLRIINILHLMIKWSQTLESELGSVPQVQRTILEIVPLLRPTHHLSEMWSTLLHELTLFLNFGDVVHKDKGDLQKKECLVETGGSRNNHEEIEVSSSVTSNDTGDWMDYGWSTSFVEKLLSVTVDLYMDAPPVERLKSSPEVIQVLGRCLNTRRDNPEGSLWKISLECFNRVVTHEVQIILDCGDKISYKSSRSRMWKEIADVYEMFLLGCCGHVLSSDAPTYGLEDDDLIEMNFLRVLCDVVMRNQIDIPVEVLQRLVTTLDRCAARMGSLPIQTVGLIPSHCSRFSLTCLEKMFSLCSSALTGSIQPPQLDVRQVSIVILLRRCEAILRQYLIDENDLGDRPLPGVRVEETVYILQQLAILVLRDETLKFLPLPAHLKAVLIDNATHGHAHLLVLYPSLLELVVSRETRVRELVQVLLRLISLELGLRYLT